MLKKLLLGIVALLFVFAFNECSAPGGGGGGAGDKTASYYLYIVTYGDRDRGTPGSVYAYACDSESGALSAVLGSPFGAGMGAVGIAADPNGKFLFVTNNNDNNISAYIIDPSTGALSPVPGSPFAAGTSPGSMAVHPNGKFLYVGTWAAQDLSAFAVDPATGVLSAIAGSPFSAGTRPLRLAVDPAGKFLYASPCFYGIDSMSGVPSVSSPLSTLNTYNSEAFEPNWQFVYSNRSDSGGIIASAIDAGTAALSSVPGSPFGTTASYLWADSVGRFLYDDMGSYLYPLIIDRSTGALTLSGPFLYSYGNTLHAAHPGGKFLYIAHYNQLMTYTIDSSTGALSDISGPTPPVLDAASAVFVARETP